MTYKKPTYEEYCKASEFARLRYKIGLYVQIIAVILFLLVMLYTVKNIEEMKSNPIDYAEKKMGVVCNLPIQYPIQELYYDGSNRNIESTEKG